MLNVVRLVGYLDSQPDLLYFANCEVLCRLSIVVKTENENGKIVHDHIDLELWNNLADLAVKHLLSEKLVGIIGSFKISKLKDLESGEIREKSVVLVRELFFPELNIDQLELSRSTICISSKKTDNTEPTLRLNINLDNLLTAFGCGLSSSDYYLDKQTGRVDLFCYFVEDGANPDDFYDYDNVRYLPIPSDEQEAIFNDMETFIELLPDPWLAMKLRRELTRKRFLQGSGETVSSNFFYDGGWSEFKYKRMEHRVISWLQSENIEPNFNTHSG